VSTVSQLVNRVIFFSYLQLTVMALVADGGKHPAKPLSDAAASHSSERVASRDTSQSKKVDRQQTDTGYSGYSSSISNSADVRYCRARFINIAVELLLTVVASIVTAAQS